MSTPTQRCLLVHTQPDVDLQCVHVYTHSLTPCVSCRWLKCSFARRRVCPRDMVKHLNSIEEQVLECRAWTADSVLWEALEQAHNKVPTVEEVSTQKHYNYKASPWGCALYIRKCFFTVVLSWWISYIIRCINLAFGMCWVRSWLCL